MSPERRGFATWGAAMVAVGALALSQAFAAARVVSLDQCADQYVLALAPRSGIAALSRRATDADSALKARATGLPQARSDLETLLALRPTIVVRAWGGDGALLGALARRRIRVLSLGDPRTFAQIREDIRSTAAALGNERLGESLIGRMNRQLGGAAGAGQGRSALYLSAGGDTAGPDTMMGALLAAAGYRNAESRAGYRAVSLEMLVLAPPSRFVLGFFDSDFSTQRWAAARHGALARLLRSRTIVKLAASELACPSWTYADAAARLAAAARGS